MYITVRVFKHNSQQNSAVHFKTTVHILMDSGNDAKDSYRHIFICNAKYTHT